MATTSEDVLGTLEANGAGAATRRRGGDAGAYLLQAVALALGYVMLDAASFLFWIDPVPVKPWNPQVGLAVALLCVAGLRHVPAVLAGALASETWLRSAGDPFIEQVLCAVALTAGVAGIAWALRRRGFPRAMASVRAMRDFFAIATLGAVATSLAYVGVSMALNGQGYDEFVGSALHKWLGDTVGMICVTPLTLFLVAPRTLRHAELPRSALWLDVVAFVVSLGIIVGVVFGPGGVSGERLFYLLFLPLIVIAVRRGLPGAAVGVAATQIAIVIALRIDERTPDDAAGYQFLMLALGATTLLLGAVAGERRRTQIELERRSAELRAQQQALSDAMRVAAASETASTLAHEMSQPLSAIGTYARAGLEMLHRDKASPGDLDNILKRIVAESVRTRETVERIREFFRTGIVRRERVDVGQLAADAADAMHDRLQAGSIALTLDIPPGLPPVDVDRVQIGTVLHNLVGNAADALGGAALPRWIRLAAREQGDFVELDVSDSGPGIDPAIQNALFEPLATTKPTGMGLGLPIARTLVHAHGGRLDLVHVHPTTFRFTLPIHGPDDT
jgi:signal transduction histidine kinase